MKNAEQPAYPVDAVEAKYRPYDRGSVIKVSNGSPAYTGLTKREQFQHSRRTAMSELYVIDLDSNGVNYSARKATPAEISAAHPKCETCGHFMAGDDDRLKDVGTCQQLNGSPYVYSWQYCPQHTEVVK